MKLKFYLDADNKKIYTLKENSPKGEKTKDAHYKFIKFKEDETKE